MATFVLIHGSMHGAWCWRDLGAHLEEFGHLVIAPDLPCDDVGAGLVEYASVVESAIGNRTTDDRLVLVGHSLGARTVPIVADGYPDSRMVFLCSAPTALGPVAPEAFSGMVTREYEEAVFDERPDGARRIATSQAGSLFFHDCDARTAAWAVERLRWQGPRPLAEPSPISNWPDRPLSMIVARDDRVARAEWLLSEARKWLDDSRPTVVPGGHSPMLSRPADLAAALIACARS